MKKVRLHQTACGYVRSSASDGLLDVSLAQQAVGIMDYCVTSQHILVRTVTEPKTSGSQPKLDRLLDRATSPKRPYDLFVVYSASRLSREPVRFDLIKRRLAAAGVKLVVLKASPASRIVPMSIGSF